MKSIKKTYFEKISSIIEKVLPAEAVVKITALKRIRKEWITIVGSKIASHTCPIDIKKNSLIINIDNPVWKTEVLMKKNDILSYIRKYGEYKEIYFNIKEKISGV